MPPQAGWLCVLDFSRCFGYWELILNSDELNAPDRRVSAPTHLTDQKTLPERWEMREAREEGFYWAILGQNPPEIAYWERGEWWLAGLAAATTTNGSMAS
jgi:hypothetical protein